MPEPGNEEGREASTGHTPGRLEQPEVVRELFITWHKRLLRASHAHYRTAELYGMFENILTVTNLIFAIVVLFLAATYQTTLSNEPPTIILGIQVDKLIPWASLLTVLTAALQYLLQFGGKSQNNKSAGMDFAGLRRKIERYWAKSELHEEAIHSVSRTYSHIGRTAPIVPRWIWRRSLTAVEKEAEAFEKIFFRPSMPPKILYDCKVPSNSKSV